MRSTEVKLHTFSMETTSDSYWIGGYVGPQSQYKRNVEGKTTAPVWNKGR
jgi:hypothetical protein